MKKVIALDAGHGQDTYKKTGSKGVPGLEEFEFNSAVVAYAIPQLEERGFSVVLTQPLDGSSIKLNRRVDVAVQADADLLISFHADASPNPRVRGHWCFYWHDNEDSKRLAEIWASHASGMLSNPSRSVRAGKPGTWTNFYMIRGPVQQGIPAILCEHGFMTNVEDYNLLRSEDFRRQCAEVVIRTVCEYFAVDYQTSKLVNWQTEMGTAAIDELARKGFLSSPEKWKANLSEPVPAWLFWEMIRRISRY